MKKQNVLITGATSGIGKATAILLAKHNFNLILCGRRKERLEQLQDALGKKTSVTILNFDVANKEKTFKAVQSISEEFLPVNILINNAGNAHGLSTIQDGSIEDWEAMINSNVKGLLYVTKAIIPNMIQQKGGFIVNIGSIAAKDVYPNGNVYCATKHAVNALSKAMRIDLNQHHVRVAAIHPGATETEFSEIRLKDKKKAKEVYKGYTPLKAEDIADIIHFVVTRPPHVNIEDLVVYPTAQATPTIINR